MFQPDLFASPTPRRMTHRRPSPTETKAATKVLAICSGLQAEILEALAWHGPMTDRELERLSQFAKYAPSTVRKRRSELYQGRRVVADGTREGLTIWRRAS